GARGKPARGGALMNGQPQGQNGNGQQNYGELYNSSVGPNLPSTMQNYYTGRPDAQKQAAKSYYGKYSLPRGTAKLSGLRQSDPSYSGAASSLQDETLGQLGQYDNGGSPVNFRRDEVNYQQGGTPLLAQLSSYVSQRLGTGLTPDEQAVIRGRGIEGVSASTAEAQRQIGNSAVASGLDPRATTGGQTSPAGQRQQQRPRGE